MRIGACWVLWALSSWVVEPGVSVVCGSELRAEDSEGSPIVDGVEGVNGDRAGSITLLSSAVE